MDECYNKSPRPAISVEDVETIRRTVPVSPGVRWLREAENDTAQLAILVDRENGRRKKGNGRAADEALARAEAIVAAAESKTRKVKTHSGREVPLSLLRETALRKLEIEFGADAPIHVECAHCHAVFFVKAGTRADRIEKTCKRGCRCECGRRMSRSAALAAVRNGYRAVCRACSVAKLSTVSRSMPADLRRARSMTAGIKSGDTRRANAAAKTHCGRGHDLSAVGRETNGACRGCVRVAKRRLRARAAAKATP